MLFWLYSTDLKKPDRERLTERVPFPFCTCSRSVSVPVLYLFRTSSVSIPFPFRSRSVSVLFLFCIHSVSVLSVCVHETSSEEQCFWEPVCKNRATVTCNFTKWVNCRFKKTDSKLTFLWWKCSQITRKIQDEDAIVASRPAESFPQMLQSDRQSLWSPMERKRNEALHTAL